MRGKISYKIWKFYIFLLEILILYERALQENILKSLHENQNKPSQAGGLKSMFSLGGGSGIFLGVRGVDGFMS